MDQHSPVSASGGKGRQGGGCPEGGEEEKETEIKRVVVDILEGSSPSGTLISEVVLESLEPHFLSSLGFQSTDTMSPHESLAWLPCYGGLHPFLNCSQNKPLLPPTASYHEFGHGKKKRKLASSAKTSF